MDIKNIFICYSQKDFLGRGLRLRNYLANLFPDLEIFIDQIKAKGTDWKNINYEKLSSADVVIVILTPHALVSEEVKNEISFSKNHSKILIPCKDDNIDLDWSEIPYDLSTKDGIEFEDDEILRTRLYKEIKKITRMNLPKQVTQIINSSKNKATHEKTFFVDAILVKRKTIDLKINDRTFSIPYIIREGDIELLNTTVDLNVNSIAIDFTCNSDSIVDLELPRTLIDSKSRGQDDSFLLLINGFEHDFEENTTAENRTLTISVPSGTTDLEIIGTEITPSQLFNEIDSKIKLPEIKSLELTIRFHANENTDKETQIKEIQKRLDSWFEIFNNCKTSDYYELTGYGHVQNIEFNNEKIILSKPRFHESSFGGKLWQACTVRIVAGKLETINKLPLYGKQPYWNLRWILASNLDVDNLLVIIQHLTGKISGSKGGHTMGARTIWTSAMFEIGDCISGKAVIHLLTGWIDLSLWERKPNTGFYRAHNLIKPETIINYLIGKMTFVQIKQLLDASCKPN